MEAFMAFVKPFVAPQWSVEKNLIFSLRPDENKRVDFSRQMYEKVYHFLDILYS